MIFNGTPLSCVVFLGFNFEISVYGWSREIYLKLQFDYQGFSPYFAFKLMLSCLLHSYRVFQRFIVRIKRTFICLSN